MTPENKFILKNPHREPLHIKSVESSCFCTTIYYDEAKSLLQKDETFTISAQFRGDMFEGDKNATLTVEIDKPEIAKILLNVRGEIRSDLKIAPTYIDFGNVELEKGSTRTLTVTYTGNNTAWRLVDVESENEFIKAEIAPPRVAVGSKEFKITVSLDKSAPHGTINTYLLLNNNDPVAARRVIPISIRATVGAVVSVNPSPLFLGVLPPGEASPVKNVALTAPKPFRVVKLECDNPAVKISSTFNADDPPKTFYLVPIQYLNPAEGDGAPQDGRMRAEVRITTDIPGYMPTFYVTMTVLEQSRNL
jgi:hypothetical protein